MLTLLRSLALLALVAWVGGIAFFAFVETQAALHVLGISRPFGDIVNYSLHALHRIGLVSGILFLTATLLEKRKWKVRANRSPADWDLRMALVAAMLLITAASEYGILPRMHRLRQTNPQLEQMSVVSGPRAEFDRLHRYSTAGEGTVLLLGLATVVLTARRLT